MKKQKLLSHKEVEYDLDQYISENCNNCGIELIKVEDILTDLGSGNYCCKSCSEILELNVVKCADII